MQLLGVKINEIKKIIDQELHIPELARPQQHSCWKKNTFQEVVWNIWNLSVNKNRYRVPIETSRHPVIHLNTLANRQRYTATSGEILYFETYQRIVLEEGRSNCIEITTFWIWCHKKILTLHVVTVIRLSDVLCISVLLGVGKSYEGVR